MKEYLAHVKQDPHTGWKEHYLEDHLLEVANMARKFAEKFNSGEWAFVAGIWHDLGKFSNDFQQYIKFKSGYDEQAHIENDQNRVNHSSAGALLAIQRFNDKGRLFAYLIAGHHAGLPDWSSLNTAGACLSKRLEDTKLLLKTREANIPEDILNYSYPTSGPQIKQAHLWIRMLFSCLVDADFLDTEFFMEQSKNEIRSNYPTLAFLKSKFDIALEKKVRSTNATVVNQCRQQILKQCIAKGKLPSGLFSLTVPTGGGKTLSSMAFALEHAILHNKQRIIYVIPYTSIIEQTAEIYTEIFVHGVIEHHSNLDLDKENCATRLASENWDAPIIVTTNVQFFESLFAARSSRTRKLHNIVNSVVIFDEVQQFPIDFLNPIIDTIQELADVYNVTCVFTSATQPALTPNSNYPTFAGLKNVTEIIENVNDVYQALKRVEIILPNDLDLPRTWEDLALELQTHKQVLCIVNSRKDCRDLFKLMPKGTIHLSALMCGEHRSRVIKKIKSLLEAGDPICIISTQLVEAGVDIDFPVVYRALAGMDSISQASGRCNREGKLTIGKVHVFIPPNLPPIGLLRKGENITKKMLKNDSIDLQAPETFQNYFAELYWKASNGLDKEAIKNDLMQNQTRLMFEFRTAAKKFKLINDEATSPVIVRYESSIPILNEIQSQPIDRKLRRKLQRYTVNISKSVHQKLLYEGKIFEDLDKGLFLQSVNSLYCPIRGFLGGYEEYLDATDFIIS